MNDTVVGILIVLGGAFAAVAGLGLIRLPDVLMRMHASTKAGTLGVGLIVAGVSLHFGGALVVAKAILIIAFLLLTAPVAAHLIGRAAYRSKTPLSKDTLMLDKPLQSGNEKRLSR
jgi:multicomponent Na+:H+ antiporter subunit G